MSQKRTKARHFAMQALYQWQISKQNPEDILAHFVEEHQRSRYHKVYFDVLFNGVVQFVDEIDQALSEVIDRDLGNLDYVEHAILRLSTFELMKRVEVPYKVVLNEAVELAKTFGADKSHKYINAVLDKLVKQLRVVEIKLSTH